MTLLLLFHVNAIMIFESARSHLAMALLFASIVSTITSALSKLDNNKNYSNLKAQYYVILVGLDDPELRQLLDIHTTGLEIIAFLSLVTGLIVAVENTCKVLNEHTPAIIKALKNLLNVFIGLLKVLLLVVTGVLGCLGILFISIAAQLKWFNKILTLRAKVFWTSIIGKFDTGDIPESNTVGAVYHQQGLMFWCIDMSIKEVVIKYSFFYFVV